MTLPHMAGLVLTMQSAAWRQDLLGPLFLFRHTSAMSVRQQSQHSWNVPCGLAVADGTDGVMAEVPESTVESWSGDSLMARAALCLKKTKADKLNDDDCDDYGWTCQGCLVSKQQHRLQGASNLPSNPCKHRRYMAA